MTVNGRKICCRSFTWSWSFWGSTFCLARVANFERHVEDNRTLDGARTSKAKAGALLAELRSLVTLIDIHKLKDDKTIEGYQLTFTWRWMHCRQPLLLGGRGGGRGMASILIQIFDVTQAVKYNRRECLVDQVEIALVAKNRVYDLLRLFILRSLFLRGREWRWELVRSELVCIYVESVD